MPSAIVVAAAAIFSALPVSAHDAWSLRSNVLSGNSTPSRGVYSGGRFLLFSSSSSTFWHSAAGTAAWNFSSLPNAPNFYYSWGAAAANGKVVVSGTNNTLYWTTAASIGGLPGTAVNWTKVNPVTDRGSASPDLYATRYLNGQFVVGVAPNTSTSYSEFLTSPDGETWTSRKIPASAAGNNYFQPRDFAFKPGATAGTGTWVVVLNNSNGIYTMPENFSSASWVNLSSIDLGSSGNQRVLFANNLFVMTTGNGKLLTSANGTSWTQRTLPAATTRLGDVFHDGTRFVVVGNTVTGSNPARPVIVHSTDGITWTQASDVPAGGELTGVFRADGLWMGFGPARNVVTSGNASVSLPELTGPFPASVNTGGTATFTVTMTGGPVPTIQWYKDNMALTDGALASGAVVSGATTTELTITGVTLAEAGSYSARASNTVGNANSIAVALGVSVSSGGAVLTPYGVTNTLGGTIVPGTSPARTVVGAGNLSTFTVGAGITYLPNTFVNPTSYSSVGGMNPAGTKVLLGAGSGSAPLMVYDLTTQSGTVLPAPALPLGPVSVINMMLPIDLADNGDVTGIIQDHTGQNRAFHFSAATSTYTLLGNVPNTGNDIASNPGGISADGRSIAGYERTSFFDGPFVWTTAGGFTLLPDPSGGAANGDVREISPNGRWIVGYGAAANALGGGQAAIRWDRGLPHGAPQARSLQKRSGDTFADARTVNDDGTTGGNVRAGFSFQDNRAAVWLPNGALIVLPEYLATKYGMSLSGLTLSQVTSISADRRTLAGTAIRANEPSQPSEGWVLTLPEPLDLPSPAADISLIRSMASLNSGATVAFGSKEVGSATVVQQIIYLRNDGTAPLTGLTPGFSGANAADFSIAFDAGVSALPSTLAVNEFVTLYIRFNPQAGSAGMRAAILGFTSNDPDENPFTLQLTGTATVPALTPAQTALRDHLAAAGVPEGKRGALDDADGDGLSNLLEFALGLHPMQPSANPPAAMVNGYLELTYVRARTDHVNYSVVASADLLAGSWSAAGVDQGTPDGSGTTTARIPASAGKGFLRLEVTLKP